MHMEDNGEETIEITIDDTNLDFNAARKNSDEIAKRKMNEPLSIVK